VAYLEISQRGGGGKKISLTETYGHQTSTYIFLRPFLFLLFFAVSNHSSLPLHPFFVLPAASTAHTTNGGRTRGAVFFDMGARGAPRPLCPLAPPLHESQLQLYKEIQTASLSCSSCHWLSSIQGLNPN
jgi:hypothetical protein